MDAFHGQPLYKSVLVVGATSPYNTGVSLRGARAAFNDNESLSGYHVLRYWLNSNGHGKKFFSHWTQSGGHERSAELVASNVVDVAAVDIGVWMRLQRDRPQLVSKLRVLTGKDCQLPNVPIQPFVAASRIPEGVRKRLQHALLSLAPSSCRAESAAAAVAAATHEKGGCGSGGGANGDGDADADMSCCEDEWKDAGNNVQSPVAVDGGVHHTTPVHSGVGSCCAETVGHATVPSPSPRTTTLRRLFMRGFVSVDATFFDPLKDMLDNMRHDTPTPTSEPAGAQAVETEPPLQHHVAPATPRTNVADDDSAVSTGTASDDDAR